MANLPRDRAPDSTLAFLREGYDFISNRCTRYRSSAFQTRLMLTPVICMRGADAARIFYEGDRLTRVGAIPRTTLMLLQDRGSAQTLDAEPHRHRKRMFMSLMTPDSIGRLERHMAGVWEEHIHRWQGRDAVVLLDEVPEILCAAVCRWAGVPLADTEVASRSREFNAMFDGAGALGPRLWKALARRSRNERWARGIIEGIRTGRVDAPEGSAARVIAEHRDADGRPLTVSVAAVELINVLRPTVAVSRFIGFAAMALHHYPEYRQALRAEPDGLAEAFVHEVRRFYPFFPVIGGRARMDFDWEGVPFPRGQWALLDLYGTNHDPGAWRDPERFMPERFEGWDGNAFSLIPQGGGDYYRSHRCAGEWATIALMKCAVRLLVTAMEYDVPEQDLHVDHSRMPARPRSGFVITRVRHAPGH
jgi:fatty-acid peroxygenase